MLNRRLARVRVMQALYALEKSKSANYLLAQDLIADAFAPDLNSMEKQNRIRLSGMIKLSQSLFEDEIKKKIESTDETTPREISMVMSKARENLRSRNKKDFEFTSMQALVNAERTYDIYLYILNLLVLLADKPQSLLVNNRAILALKTNTDLEYCSLKRSVNFDGQKSFVNSLYNETIKDNPHVLEYVAIVNKTLEDDLAIVKYLVKNVILRTEQSSNYFENLHIYWLQDREILRIMVFHSFNDFIAKQTVKIEQLDDQWEDTKGFLRVLFKETAERDEEILNKIVPHLKNWDIERIIETDLILLKMAVAEMITFPSIPVKVTINETLEISKEFSTAKSNVFINGILDSLYKELNKLGMIKKTGRGMIDNK